MTDRDPIDPLYRAFLDDGIIARETDFTPPLAEDDEDRRFRRAVLVVGCLLGAIVIAGAAVVGAVV